MNKSIVLNEKGTPYLYFPILENIGMVRHGFSTRQGGVSRQHLSTMNLSYLRGDDPEAVTENFRRITKAMGVDPERMAFSDQTHTTNIRQITENDAGKGFCRERDYYDIDGLITNVPGITLVTFYADCVPLYFVDTRNRAIGLSHSGWKGTVGKIGQKTIEAMGEAYGSRPEDIVAAIGPSICRFCYEISEDVADQFKGVFADVNWTEYLEDRGQGKYHLDLWKVNQLVLEEAGLKKEQITVSDLCTCCNPDLLFSHRASKGMRGNLAAFLCLKEGEEL